MEMSNYLIYGANGYTGALIAKEAVQRGHSPILAGRNAVEVQYLANSLGLQSRIFSLDDVQATQQALKGIKAILHCAGPFARTTPLLVPICLQEHVHYLDVTGEITVFEMLAALDERAKKAGVMLLPGVGFDVVPTDCLAVHLHRRLPTAAHLSLGFQGLGKLSRGTATTMIENLSRGGAIRREGKMRKVPPAWRTRTIDFGRGPTIAMTIPWGDVSTAWYSTGIPNIEVYLASTFGMRFFTRMLRLFGWVFTVSWIRAWAINKVRTNPPGPSEQERARGWTLIWGEALDARGSRVVSRLKGPEGYTATVKTAIASIERLLHGTIYPGFQTPGRLFGPDFITSIDGFQREDLN